MKVVKNNNKKNIDETKKHEPECEEFLIVAGL